MNLFKKSNIFQPKLTLKVSLHLFSCVHVYVYVWKHMSYSSYIEVKRQLWKLAPCGLQRWNAGHQACLCLAHQSWA